MRPRAIGVPLVLPKVNPGLLELNMKNLVALILALILADAPCFGQTAADPCADAVNAGRNEEGVRECTRQITGESAGKDLVRAYYVRGLAHVNLKQHTEAIADFSKVIELRPDAPLAYVMRSRSYSALERIDLAMQDAQKAVELGPNFYRAYDNRGDRFFLAGDMVRARADYARTVELNPKYTDGWWDLGRTDQFLGKFDLAAVDFAKAVELSPGFHWTSLYLVLATRFSGGDTNAVIAKFRERLAASKPEPWLETLSQYYVGADKVDEGVVMARAREGKDDAERASRLQDAYFHIGAKRLMDGNRAGAVEYLQKCIDLGGNSFSYMSAKYLLQQMNERGAAFP